MGLDLLGHARALYTRAGELEGRGRTEDDFAYLRPRARVPALPARGASERRLRVHDGAPAALLRRNAAPWWHRAQGSTDPTVAGIAAKAAAELRYHVRHAGEWVIRLGDGTDESERRTRAAIDALWPDVDELFHVTPGARTLRAGRRPARPVRRARRLRRDGPRGLDRGRTRGAARARARRGAVPRAGAPAATPRRSATCSRRCSRCRAATPGRAGEPRDVTRGPRRGTERGGRRGPRRGVARRGGRARPRGAVRDGGGSGDPRRRRRGTHRRARGRPMARDGPGHADLFGLPRRARDRARGRRGARRGRLRAGRAARAEPGVDDRPDHRRRTREAEGLRPSRRRRARRARRTARASLP